MQSIRKSILGHISLRRSSKFLRKDKNVIMQLRCLSSPADTNYHQILDQVIGLVKKYDRINTSKVTERADFQKDLNLDSLDRVELIMALEEEFSIEIPDEKAEKLTSCADVAKYIASEASQKDVENP